MDIQIKETQIPKLIEFYQGVQVELARKINALKSEYEENEVLLSSLRNSSSSNLNNVNRNDLNSNYSSQINGFNREWTWGKKISYILEEAGDEMPMSAIVDRFIILQESSSDEISNIKSSISATLSQNIKLGKLFYKEERHGLDNLYGLIQWKESIIGNRLEDNSLF